VAPLLDVNGGMMSQLEASTDAYVDSGATCTDIHDGQIDGSVVTTGTVNLMVATPADHPFTIEYTCCNSDGLCATAYRHVYVSDHRCPTCVLDKASEITIEASFPYDDAGVNCTSPVQEQAYTAYQNTQPMSMIDVTVAQYGCTITAGRCYWPNAEKAKVSCASWSACEAIYCNEHTTGCWASGSGDSSTYAHEMNSVTYAKVTRDREVDVSTVGSVDVELTGTYVLEYTGTDTNSFANTGTSCTSAQDPLVDNCCVGGNALPLKRTVTVIDTLKPVIGLKHMYAASYLHISSEGPESLYASPGAGNPAASHFSISDDFMVQARGSAANTWLAASIVVGAAGVALLSFRRRPAALSAESVSV